MSNILIINGFLGNFSEGIMAYLYQNLSKENKLITPNLVKTENNLLPISRQIEITKTILTTEKIDLVIGYSLGGYICFRHILENNFADLNCPILLIAPLVSPANFIKTRFTEKELKQILNQNENQFYSKDFGRDRVFQVNKTYVQDFLLAKELDFLQIPENIITKLHTISFLNDHIIHPSLHLNSQYLLRIPDNHQCIQDINRKLVLNYVKILNKLYLF